MSTNLDKFVITADLPVNTTTLQVANDLRLNYFGTKTLTDDSLMRKADVQALIAAAGGR